MTKEPRAKQPFLPKLYLSMKDYSRAKLTADLIAGVTVGIVALPLAMAFAIASGVTPQAGIYTAIAAGFVVSALGGSRCQIAGPTGAFVLIVAGIASVHGVAGLIVCTGMAGVMLLIMGVTGLGSAIRYIPRPVTIGFTNGIAVLIASTQIKDFLGLDIRNAPQRIRGPPRVPLPPHRHHPLAGDARRMHRAGHYSFVAPHQQTSPGHDRRSRGDHGGLPFFGHGHRNHRQ